MSISRFASYNLVGQIAPVIVSLVTMPLFVEVIGLERYGVLSICWLLLGYFGLLDLGLGRAATQQIASLREASGEARSEVFWTVFWLSSGLALVALVLAYPLFKFGFSLQETSASFAAEVYAVTPWLAGSLALSMISGLWSAAVVAREKFAFVNIVDSVTNVAMSVVPLLVAWLIKPDLVLLVASSLAVRLLSSLTYVVAAIKVVPVKRPSRPKRAIAKKLLAYGGWSTVIATISPFLWNWDRFAIGSVIGAAAVSLYVIPFQLVWRLTIIPGALTSALFPRLAAEAESGALALQNTAILNLRSLMTPVILVAIAVMEPFVALWLGPKIGLQTADVAHILLPGIWINAIAAIGINVLLAQGRPAIVARLHLSEVIPYGLLLYILMVAFGIEGAALAWTIRVAADALCMLRISTGNFSFGRLLVVPGAIVTVMSLASSALPVTSALRWTVVAVTLVIGLAWSVRSAPQQSRDLVAALARRVLQLTLPKRFREGLSR